VFKPLYVSVPRLETKQRFDRRREVVSHIVLPVRLNGQKPKEDVGKGPVEKSRTKTKICHQWDRSKLCILRWGAGPGTSTPSLHAPARPTPPWFGRETRSRTPLRGLATVLTVVTISDFFPAGKFVDIFLCIAGKKIEKLGLQH